MPKSKFPFAETEYSQLKKGVSEVHYSAHRHYYGLCVFIDNTHSRYTGSFDPKTARQIRVYRDGVLMRLEYDFSLGKDSIAWVKPINQQIWVFMEWAVYDRICPDTQYAKEIAREVEILNREKPTETV